MIHNYKIRKIIFSMLFLSLGSLGYAQENLNIEKLFGTYYFDNIYYIGNHSMEEKEAIKQKVKDIVFKQRVLNIQKDSFTLAGKINNTNPKNISWNHVQYEVICDCKEKERFVKYGYPQFEDAFKLKAISSARKFKEVVFVSSKDSSTRLLLEPVNYHRILMKVDQVYIGYERKDINKNDSDDDAHNGLDDDNDDHKKNDQHMGDH